MGRKVGGVGISLAGFSFWVAACGCCCGTTWSTARAAIAKPYNVGQLQNSIWLCAKN